MVYIKLERIRIIKNSYLFIFLILKKVELELIWIC